MMPSNGRLVIFRWVTMSLPYTTHLWVLYFCFFNLLALFFNNYRNIEEQNALVNQNQMILEKVKKKCDY